MQISLWVLAAIYAMLIFDQGNSEVLSFFRRWQFHIYLYNLFLLLYTIFHRHFLYIVLSGLLLSANYFSLAKTANLFFNQENETSQSIEISYQKGRQGFIPAGKDTQISHVGKLLLSPNFSADYQQIEHKGQSFMVIRLDFSNKHQAELPTAFENLEKYILQQDIPVIVVGDFGQPVWSPIFRKFLQKTGLSVKNRILFTDGKESFKFWNVPSINILAFDNIGIQNLSFKNKEFQIRLGY